MTDVPPRAELLLAQEVPDDLAEELVAALTALGAPPARTRRTIGHRGVADIPWAVLVSLPLQAFLGGLGAEAMKDAYASFKGLVRKVARPASPAPDGLGEAREARPLLLQDPVGGLGVVLEADLPAEAYERLVGLDLTAFSAGPLHYDRAQGRWRSVLDEAAG
ncbi:hypothetical protein [Streptomyces sp. NRRL S-1521]|uniref:hypothetical protein n=1 Tax=Streptomyces sp. NRRL S-1521 TaxID=1609100 RepID=UPI00074AFDDF|nr:hypothetical protein [Streptomyces sp. NRRL S-1521]KUL54422.1 hypothetical protein ADL30_16300 [Streptomyces sp. NRRL S-1521]